MMTTSRYFRKDKYGREFFDYRAYDDDEQMKELKKISQEQQKRKVAFGGIKGCLKRLFASQKSL